MIVISLRSIVSSLLHDLKYSPYRRSFFHWTAIRQIGRVHPCWLPGLYKVLYPYHPCHCLLWQWFRCHRQTVLIVAVPESIPYSLPIFRHPPESWEKRKKIREYDKSLFGYNLIMNKLLDTIYSGSYSLPFFSSFPSYYLAPKLVRGMSLPAHTRNIALDHNNEEYDRHRCWGQPQGETRWVLQIKNRSYLVMNLHI